MQIVDKSDFQNRDHRMSLVSIGIAVAAILAATTQVIAFLKQKKVDQQRHDAIMKNIQAIKDNITAIGAVTNVNLKEMNNSVPSKT